MARMTSRQFEFCNLYLDPKVGGAVNAYRRAYSPKNSSDETVARNVARLLKNPLVDEYIAMRRKDAAEKSGLTLQGHLDRLDEIARLAIENNQLSAAVTAEVSRGKAAGLYKDKREVDGTLTVKWAGDDGD